MEEYECEIVKEDKKGEVNEEQIKRIIDLLKDESSDHLSILEDLNKIMDKFHDLKYKIDKIFLEMGLLSSAIKIFEEKKGDEKIIVYLYLYYIFINNVLVIIIRKIGVIEFKIEGINLYKEKDAIDPLYLIMRRDFKSKIREDAIKAIITIAKKYPSDVINNYYVEDSCKYILPSNDKCSDEDKRYIYILFKELIKEGIIKNGEEGSEIIEEILYIAERKKRKEEEINGEGELMNEINDFIKITKEKGFEERFEEIKNIIIAEDIHDSWIKLCKEEDDGSNDDEEGVIKEEDKEKIRKFCRYVAGNSFDVQIHFLGELCNIMDDDYKYSDEFECYESMKNGLFLYYYLPFLFKVYHFEETFPEFLKKVNDKYEDIPECYDYLIKLHDDLIEKIMKESEEIEINEEKVIIIMFLWSIIKKGKRKKKEIEYLTNSTVKVFEWLGRIEEEKEEKIKEVKNEEGVKGNVNRKEMIVYKLIDIISCSLWSYSNEDKMKLKKDGKFSKVLLEIVKNHLKKEKDLIQKGNKKRIMEYIIYSYNKYIETSDLLSIPCYSFPFSNNTIIYILYYINKYFVSDDNNEIIKKDMFIDIVELINNIIDIKKIIEENDIKKEMEAEISVEWSYNIINKIKQKISFFWIDINKILSSLLDSVDVSSFNEENNNIMKRMINVMFNHNNNNIHNIEKEKEKNNENMKKMKLIRPFIIDEENRKCFIRYFIFPFTNKYSFSMLNVYYLINKSKEGCNIISIFTKELTGEIVDTIKKREGNNITKERRRYERERNDEELGVIYCILESLSNIICCTYIDRNIVHLGWIRNKEEYKGKEKEIKEDKDHVSDIIVEEDIRECLILYLKHMGYKYNYNTNKYEHKLSSLSRNSNNASYYLLFVNGLKEER